MLDLYFACVSLYSFLIKMDLIDKGDDSLSTDEIVTNKRGRKKKVQNSSFDKLPASATKNLSPELVDELQHGYEILQTILRMAKIDPFVVKPDSNLFGLSNYYNIISRPMWLDEVKRKLKQQEYKGISEVVDDIRLMLENCYRFWGPTHKFTRKGLRIEQKLEQKIDTLPPELRTKCIGDTNVEEAIDEEPKPDESNNDEAEPQDDEQSESKPLKMFQSKILNRVLEAESNHIKKEEDLEDVKRREEQMLAWEKETLVSDEHREEIKSMWQLAEIGHFLRLTCETLNIEEITQYELERMLLMPRESKTLATLMTSMLSPATIRASLDVKPVMPYEIWTTRLKKRLDDWFSIFYKTSDFVEAFKSCGVEPHFWMAMCTVNPLENKPFHELTFSQRVWVLKSLCNNLFHTNKPIQDVFLEETHSTDMRETSLGTCNGYNYFYLPFSHEIRVYKQKILEQAVNFQKFSGVNQNLFFKYWDLAFNHKWDEMEKVEVSNPKKDDFYMVADDMESLLELIEGVKKEGKNKISNSFKLYLKEAKRYTQTTEGLETLYTQWNSFQNEPETKSNIAHEWKDSHQSEVLNKNDKPECSTSEVLGKRRSKVNMFYANLDMTDSSDSNSYVCESDISDWEEATNKKKKKSGPPRKQAKTKEVQDEVVEINSDPEENDQEMKVTIKQEKQSADDVTVDYNDVKPNITQLIYQPIPGQEPLDVKPVISVLNNQKDSQIIENLVPYMNNSAGQTQSPSSSTRVPLVRHIKAEVEDDVISISSDEEKPDVKSLNKNLSLRSVLSQPLYNNPPMASVQNIGAPSLSQMLQQVPQMVPMGQVEGMPQLMGQAMNQGVVQGMTQGVGQGLTQGMAQGLTQGMPQGLNQGMAQGITQGMGQGLTQGMGQGLTQGMGQGAVQRVGQTLAPGVGQTMAPGVGQALAPGVGQGMAHGVGQTMGPGVGQTLAAGVGVVRGMTQGVRGQWSQGQVKAGASMQQNYLMRSPSTNMNFNMSPRLGPRNASPIQGRLRSPYTPRQRTPSPYQSPVQRSPLSSRGPSPRATRASTPRQTLSRNLFNSPPPKPLPPEPTIEGFLEVGQRLDGSYGYTVRLPDGGIINMSRNEIDEIRKKNNGALPSKVEVPLVKKPGPLKF